MKAANILTTDLRVSNLLYPKKNKNNKKIVTIIIIRLIMIITIIIKLTTMT